MSFFFSPLVSCRFFPSPSVFCARQFTESGWTPPFCGHLVQQYGAKTRDVKSQHERCEARCGVGAGKTQQCRFPANFELSAVFFRVCKNGLQNVTYCPTPRGCRFSQMWRKRQHEIKLHSAIRERARDKSTLESPIRVNCHIGQREKA